MYRTISLTLFIFTVFCLSGRQAGEGIPDRMALIPGDTFIMGSNVNPHSISYPAHPVTIDSFYMDRFEVTNKEYLKFCTETGHRLPEFWGLEVYKSGPEFPDYPVTGVSQADAEAYAEWTGKRLPTEAEWEYAARGGLEDTEFPYGQEADRSKARYNNPAAEKGPVRTGSFEPNGFGLYDMSGNVWEWVSDWFDGGYFSNSPVLNPKGPTFGDFKVFKGGGWHSGSSCTTVYRRNALPKYWVDIAGGFRCARDLR